MASTENGQKIKEHEKKEKKEAKEKKDSEKDKWHVKTLEEIMEEKRKRKEQQKAAGESGVRLEEGELHPEKSKSRSPNRERAGSEESEEKVEEEFDALQIQPPQATSKKDSKSHRKEEKRKHSHRGNRDRERRHKSKRSHSKEKREHGRSRLDHSKEQRRARRDERHEEQQSRQTSHDRAQQREALAREQQQREQERHWREREQREQSRKERDRLERLERDREREREHKKRSERQREMERYREKVPGKERREDRSRERRRGKEEQWRRQEEIRHGRPDKRWVERDRSPQRAKPQPRPLMDMQLERPKPRSPYGKHEHEGSARDREPLPAPVPLMELKVERPPGKKRSPVPTKSKNDIKSEDKEKRREEKKREHRKRELVEHPPEEEMHVETAEHESSDSEDTSSDDSDDSGESGDDSEAKSGSEASSDDSDSDDDSDEESEEEEEEGHAQQVEEKKEEGERPTSEEDSGSDGSDSDSDSDSDSESDKESGSESEKSGKEEVPEKKVKKEEKEIKPKVESRERRKSPEAPIRRPQKSKFERDSSPSNHEDEATQSSDGDYLQESPPQSPVEFKEALPPYLPAVSGCRSVEEFVCLNKIEEGTYGVVYRAKEKRNDEVVALKRLKMEKEKEGFPITSLREINTLLKAQHPNIVTVREIVVGSNMDKIYIVMDYVEHDLKSLMETMKQPFTIGEVKCLMQQLLRGVHHLHDNWILHRDLKTSNLLLSHRGVLKIGDFGLAREYGSPLKMYTPIVVTLWYRAPELLLGAKEYACPIDMWSVGCIFAEFITMKPLFPGRSEVDQLNRIFKELGTPSEKIWPGYNELPAVKKMTFAEHPYNNLRNRFGAILTDLGFELMNKFLTYNPSKRVTAEDALKHPYFKESPLPIEESMFPTWPAKSEMTRSAKIAKSPKPPEGGMQYANLGGDEEEGFRLTLPSHGSSAKSIGFSLKF